MNIKFYLSLTILLAIAFVSVAATRVDIPRFIRISVSSSGEEGKGIFGYKGSYHPSVTKDGRYIAFESSFSNLVSGDTNFSPDIFVHDLQENTTECVSVNTLGEPAGARFTAISSDGRYVAFESVGENIVVDDFNFVSDIFVRDRALGETTRVSVSSSGNEVGDPSGVPSISGNGRFVAFASSADDLVSNPVLVSSRNNIYIHDRLNDTTELVSIDPTGWGGYSDSYIPSISEDGRYVAFDSSATNLIAADSNAVVDDIFVRDRTDGVTELISVSSAGVQGNGFSNRPSISSDGRFVVFESIATNLLDSKPTSGSNIFVRDRAGTTTEIVSISSASVLGNGGSYKPSISADGRYIGFSSSASNLVEADNNGLDDVFIHDRQSGQTVCLTCSATSITSAPNEYYTAVQANGSVVFNSDREGLVLNDTNKESDIFMSNIIFRDFSYTLFYPAIFGKAP